MRIKDKIEEIEGYLSIIVSLSLLLLPFVLASPIAYITESVTVEIDFVKRVFGNGWERIEIYTAGRRRFENRI